MQTLTYNQMIRVNTPVSENEILDKNDLTYKVGSLINSGLNIKSYRRDVIKDPELCFLLMIIDDNGIINGMRRKDILSSIKILCVMLPLLNLLYKIIIYINNINLNESGKGGEKDDYEINIISENYRKKHENENDSKFEKNKRIKVDDKENTNTNILK